ncbi:MAG TPA: alpha/beta fold hydrolase, partial [Acidimicrobiales bacterium]
MSVVSWFRSRAVDRTAPHGRHVDLPGDRSMYVREALGPRRAPTLVLLHGLAATAALNWDASVPALARRYHVVAPDHRGHGRGIRCGGRFTLEDCADDAAALIAAVADRPVVVVGYSMGGPITQLLCRRHPELVAGMVLCATSRDFRGRPAERLRFAALAPVAMACRLLPPAPWESVPGGLVQQRRLAPVLDELAGHEPRALVAAAASLGTFTSRTWVGELPAPGAVVVTDRDRTVPPRRQLKLAAALDAPVVRIDAGHLAAPSQPAVLAPAILRAADLL